MQLIWVEDSFPQKDKAKINNYQLDSSRTTDSVSYLYITRMKFNIMKKKKFQIFLH